MISKCFKNYIHVTNWNEHHDWPTTGGLRHLIFNAKTNGFNKVVVRIGGRVLIDQEEFFDWLESKVIETDEDDNDNDDDPNCDNYYNSDDL